VDGTRPYLSAALSGSLLGVAWLSGHHEIPIYLSLAAVAAWGWFSFRSWRHDVGIVKLAGVSLSFTVLASGLQTVPALEYGRHALRWAGGSRWAGIAVPLVHNSFAPLSSLAGILIPGFGVPVSLYVGVAASL
jgi:hypothetical protein